MQGVPHWCQHLLPGFFQMVAFGHGLRLAQIVNGGGTHLAFICNEKCGNTQYYLLYRARNYLGSHYQLQLRHVSGGGTHLLIYGITYTHTISQDLAAYWTIFISFYICIMVFILIGLIVLVWLHNIFHIFEGIFEHFTDYYWVCFFIVT